MKAVILAGGFGTRISEETDHRPKPMVEIGGKPILWHIMKTYSHYGIKEFIICCGYKGYVIKEYFANYFLHMSDVTFDMKNNQMQVHHNHAEDWKVTLVDTGLNTMTGGRLKRIKEYLENEDFCFTYGDGLSDVSIDKVIYHHKKKGLLATVTGTYPPGRFGTIKIEADKVTSFEEKPVGSGGLINGGFFVLSPLVLDYIKGDDSIFEREPMNSLAKDKQMTCFVHEGFWQPMDTLREKIYLEKLWASGNAPWKVWN